MTHYTIDYEGLTPQEAYNKSIENIKEYLGEERFDKITAGFRHDCPGGLSLEQFEFYLCLVGVSGFPVRAWHDHVFPFG